MLRYKSLFLTAMMLISGGQLSMLAQQVSEKSNMSSNLADAKHYIYAEDRTDWDALGLYAWGTSELFGGWPGIASIEEREIDGITYKVFPLYNEEPGSYNLIFNNRNNGKQTPDFNIAGDRDYYLIVTDSIVTERKPEPKHFIYAEDRTGWDALGLYAWGTSELFGGWPGIASIEEREIDGITYKVFPLYNEEPGSYNLIFNNRNNGKQTPDFNIAGDRDYYLIVTDSIVTERKPEPKHFIYAEDRTGWDALGLYAWGTSELFGGWPGIASIEEREIDGITYKVFPLYNEEPGSYNLIFNNRNNGKQTPDFNIAGDRDYYLIVTETSVTERGGEPVKGDVNGDGSVDIVDVNCVINVILVSESAGQYEGRDDVNKDGCVDILDVNEVINIILGAA